MSHTLSPFFFLGKQEIRWYCHATMRVFRRVLPVLMSLFSVAQFSCQTATPLTRIDQNPVMFRMLSPEHQVLVQQGRICEGMSKDAVFLAWGTPNTPPVQGQQGGLAYEKWVYNVYRPVMVDSVGFGTGCWHHGHWYGGGMSTSTAMVPEEAAWVIFQNNCVTAWESRK